MDFASLLGGGGGGSKEFGSSTATSSIDFGDDAPKSPNWIAIVAVAGLVILAGLVVVFTLNRKG